MSNNHENCEQMPMTRSHAQTVTCGIGSAECWCVFKSDGASPGNISELTLCCQTQLTITRVVLLAETTWEADNPSHYTFLFLNNMFTVVAGRMTSRVCREMGETKVFSVWMLMTCRISSIMILLSFFQLCLMSCVDDKDWVLFEQCLPVPHVDETAENMHCKRAIILYSFCEFQCGQALFLISPQNTVDV